MSAWKITRGMGFKLLVHLNNLIFSCHFPTDSSEYPGVFPSPCLCRGFVDLDFYPNTHTHHATLPKAPKALSA